MKSSEPEAPEDWRAKNAAEGKRIRKISMWYALHPRTVPPPDWTTVTGPSENGGILVRSFQRSRLRQK